MSEILNRDYTLVLNSLYTPVGVTSIREALTAMNSTKNGENMAADALDLHYGLNDDGSVNYNDVAYYPTNWDNWIELPVRDFDIPIRTVRLTLRAPIIIVAKNYSKIPNKRIKLSKRSAYEHYGKKCVWSGRELSFNEASLEHMTPRSHNGEMTWDNIAIADRKLNAERGNIPIDQWKYKAKYQPNEPKIKPMSILIDTPNRPEWEYFLIVKKKKK